MGQLSPSLAVTMGHYFFTATDGKEHKAEFSLAFVQQPSMTKPLIALHHSSFPFCSTCSPALETAAVSPALETAAVADASYSRLAPAAVVSGAVLAILAAATHTRYRQQQSGALVALLDA